MVNKDGWIVLLYFLLFLFLSWKVPFVVGALVLGFYFSIVLSVPYDFVVKRTGKKWIAIIVYVFVIFLFSYSIISFVPTTVEQIQNIFENTKNLRTGSHFPSWLVSLLNELKSNVTSIMLSILNKILSVLPSLISMVMLLVVTLVGIESIKEHFKDNLQFFFIDQPSYGERFSYEFFKGVRTYIRGQVLVSLISAVLVTIGLFFLNIHSAIALGVLMFLGSFFPFVGQVVSAVPMYLLAISTGGLRKVVLLTIILIIVNQLESWFYGPKIQGNNLKLHWFVILISIFIFTSLIGFVGVLIALPILIFLRTYWKYYLKGDVKE